MAAFSAAAASADEPLRPTLDVSDFRVTVSFLSTTEFTDLQRRYGASMDWRDIRQSHRRGFSILKTNRETGGRICEIYLPKEHRPRQIDDAGTLSLGHELLHCMYGNYHR